MNEWLTADDERKIKMEVAKFGTKQNKEKLLL